MKHLIQIYYLLLDKQEGDFRTSHASGGSNCEVIYRKDPWKLIIQVIGNVVIGSH